MKKSHRELHSLIRSLPQPRYWECLGALYAPLVELKRRVLYFEGPYSVFRAHQDGFDPLIRFVLNRAESGDPLAQLVRAEIVQRDRTLRLAESRPTPPTDYWTEFFTVNKAAWDEFHRSARPELFLDRTVLHEEQFQRDPSVDSALSMAVLTHLGAFGFRRLAKSFQTDILGEPLVIKWDKGTLSISISLTLRIDHRCFFVPLAEPFSSGACFDYSLAGNVGARMRAFVKNLVIVFPDLLQAIHDGMQAQDAWLRGTSPNYPTAAEA